MIKQENQAAPDQAWRDEEVWIRKSAANPVEFRPLYERYFKRIFLFVLHRVGDKDAAGDIAQQVFLSALTNIGRYKIRKLPFSAWLFRIAINACNDHFRKASRSRTIVLEEEALNHLHEELTSDQTFGEWESRLPSLLAGLPARDLQIIELRYFEERPFREIADILGITENNVKVRTYRALDRMKKMFLTMK